MEVTIEWFGGPQTRAAPKSLILEIPENNWVTEILISGNSGIPENIWVTEILDSGNYGKYLGVIKHIF